MRCSRCSWPFLPLQPEPQLKREDHRWLRWPENFLHPIRPEAANESEFSGKRCIAHRKMSLVAIFRERCLRLRAIRNTPKPSMLTPTPSCLPHRHLDEKYTRTTAFVH